MEGGRSYLALGELAARACFLAGAGKLPAPRGDIDNYVKSVFDAFNGVVWEDDAQVVELRARKEYGPEAMISAFVQVLSQAT